MGQFLYTLVVFLALLRPNIAEPYGRLGCRFSPVCEEQEVCVEDKLFGTCSQQGSSYLPSYKLDNSGLKRLKSTIRYLINSGYAWDDKYAQDSLRTVLEPYRREFLDMTQANVQAYVEEWLARALEEELTLEYLEEVAKDYEDIFNEQFDEYQQQQQQQGPYLGYNDQQARGYYGYIVEGGESSQGEESVDLTYLGDVAEEYIRLAEKAEAQENNNLQRLYKLYLEKYKDYLPQGQEDNQGSLENQGSFDYPGGGNSEDEITQEDDWRILQKLQKIKEDLQDVYDDNQNELPDEDEGAAAFQSSDSESLFSESEGESSDRTQAEDESPVGTQAEIESPVVEEEMSEDSWGPIVTETVTPSRIEELVPSETENALNELFGSYMYDQEEWNKLTEEQREVLLNKMLSALGLLEQSSLGSAAEEFDDDSQEDSSPLEMGNGIMNEIPIPAGFGVVEKKAKEDDEAWPDDYENADTNSLRNAPQVEVGVPDDKTPTEEPHKEKATEPPSGYVFIALLFGVTQYQGEILVQELANLLDIRQSAFSEVDVNDKTITFKVNEKIMSPQEVAEAAASFKQDFREEMGVTITATGVGRETHVKVLETPSDNSSTLVILTVVLVLCVLGILIAVITVYCVRQKVKIKQKLQSLSSGAATETEASADYQDLCRQRMASKSSEKPEPLSRINSVAMSEGAQPSPSSRSSTSSWSEEPVQSNMDISTGHIVLSYMEDHLKNKDRLHEEWEALCNYEADMCSTNVGASNTSKNRQKEALPYDHTRVVLNDSSNASRSDYINASTITDTDPRSPAYIATQAPLPTTLADFWQMVWEQGSVVIVNLCKLTENDVSRHRYWPEEGSALYHIYEVHLVSEHVWCEDYLVRSFYLKNLETQETRTVTQFHFLTWPEDGVPPSPKSALEFRRKVNKSYRGRACPIVVHCSDGVGRTGTYCLMDMVLTRMTKGAKEIDIAATLEHIRDQRPRMVKNKDQFEFALQAVAEEVNAILKALPQ